MVQPDAQAPASAPQPPAAPQPAQAPATQQPAQPPAQPAEQPQQAAPKEPQPDGAFARFQAADGSADAWLRTDEGDDPVGYVRENTEPPRTVRYTNPAHWAEDVDQRGMQQVDGGQQAAATDDGQEQNVSEVTAALQQLADGERKLDDVTQLFREREWPRRAEPGGDSQPPGSFAEVADAYSSGLINHDQYVALAQAATEAMREQSGMGDNQ